MTRHYPTLFKRQRSRYISWNILLFSGLGLWIALCTSNMYRSDIWPREAVSFYGQNSSFGIACNVSTEMEGMDDTLYVMATDYTLSSATVILRALLDRIHIFAFVCLVILSACMEERIRKKIEVWNNIFHRRYNTSSIILHLSSLMRKHRENPVLDKQIDSNDRVVLRCKLSVNSEINIEQKTLPHDRTNDDCAWTEQEDKNIIETNVTIVQNKVVFNSYTLLLFNNYELYRYYNNQRLKDTCNSLRYLAIRDSKFIECDTRASSEMIGNLPSKKCIRKRVVSSSPEFKRFLENLKRSQFFHPFMLEFVAILFVHFN